MSAQALHNVAHDTMPPLFADRLAEDDIRLTEQARDRFRALNAQVDARLAGIRIYVRGGGCNGMTYGMTMAETTGPLDAVLEGDGFRLVIDAVALNYLRGCTIDYTRQGLNESFVFQDVFQSVGGSGACGGCASAGKGKY